MATSYAKLQSQIAALQRQADSVRKTELAGVVKRIKEAIVTYGLTADDLFPPSYSNGQRKGRSAGGAMRDTTNGSTPHEKSAAGTRRPAAKKARAASSTATGRAVAIKYRDGDNTWTGRGSRPRWLQAALADGKTLDQFRVANA